MSRRNSANKLNDKNRDANAHVPPHEKLVYNRFAGGSRNIYPETTNSYMKPLDNNSRSFANNNNNNNNNNSVGHSFNNNYGSGPRRAPSTNLKAMSTIRENDYSNHYIHSKRPPIKHVRNIQNPMEGYPKLQKLHQLKKNQILQHAVKPYGCKITSELIIPTLKSWINDYELQFDVIMIGALVENQFIQPLLYQLPLYKLCAKPGFLFIWATTQKIQELTKFLNSDVCNKKFRRSEELVFVLIDKNSPYYPNDSTDCKPLFTKHQWHCWMCITGTVRRSTDNHLIHCNVDTDLQIENNETNNSINAVPDSIYKVAENFSNSNRRLHIIPSRIGYNLPIKLRPGWVIMSPDVLINNFDPSTYERDMYTKSMIRYKTVNNTQKPQFLISQTNEIEELRPKSPINVKS